MALHRVAFAPSGRQADLPHNATIAEAAEQAGETLSVECGGRGACGRCLVQVEEGEVPDYRVLRREAGHPQVLACQTPVQGPLVIRPLTEARLPRLVSRLDVAGSKPLAQWAPKPLPLEPVPVDRSDGVPAATATDLGVAVDIGTTTIRLLVIRLADGVVLGDAARYNPQIPLGADVIARIVAAEKGQLERLSTMVRQTIKEMTVAAARGAGAEPAHIRAYVAAGNLTMIHLLLGLDPAPIRQVPCPELRLSLPPVKAESLELPGQGLVRFVPAVGGWVGGDVMAGVMRSGLPTADDAIRLYVDLGTNGEIVLGNAEFALTCACSAGPAFEGGGIRCGMRADKGAIDGARINPATQSLELSVIRGGPPRGICGSGLIALADVLFRSGWIDRRARFTSQVPEACLLSEPQRRALSLSADGKVALWERDLASLVRAKAAVFAGIRTLLGALGVGAGAIEQVVVSGNFGRFLNLPAAVAIGLLHDLPPERYTYVDNGSLEGASLLLLSQRFAKDLEAYLKRVTYVDLSEVPGYMDEFVGASFLPHTDPGSLGT